MGGQAAEEATKAEIQSCGAPDDWTRVRALHALRRGAGGGISFRCVGCKQGVCGLLVGISRRPLAPKMDEGEDQGRARPPPDCETSVTISQRRNASTFLRVKWKAKNLSHSFLSQMGKLKIDPKGCMFHE